MADRTRSTHTRRSGPGARVSGRPRRRVWALPRALPGALLAALLAGACAGPGTDVHAAPLFSHLSTAGGGREFEALAGAVRVRRAHPAGRVEEWALRPLVSQRIEDDGDTLARFLVPLGSRTDTPEEGVTQLLPLYRFHRFPDEHGHPEWRLLVFPVVLWSQDVHGRVMRAFFPFGGVIERFLSFDRLTFFLFPLLAKSERGDVTSWHVLWPVLCTSSDIEGSRGWRIWPLYGVSKSSGYDRRFFLWPIFQHQRNNLRFAPERRETKWMVFPLLGHTYAGSFDSWSVLWPFFGYSRNSENGFWAWDGPWPLVRFQRPGTSGLATRSRVWPLWSSFQDTTLESTWVLWPLFNQRHELFEDGERRAEYLNPLWQNWVRTNAEGEHVESWTKFWPLYQHHAESRGTHGSRTALPSLIPLWHTPIIDDHYAWLYELYTREVDGSRVRERSWGGIWRRDTDTGERRTYLSFLWSRRKYRELGVTVRESSLLLGLIRWRTRSGLGTTLMRPAFPGPGWPAERLPER